ncbi:hypothetical protein JTB14_004403 [Gonioctena quinquepunctata]|nr:hypothetical protein JTB14_004403 [Gonioctena quinquepunctata]
MTCVASFYETKNDNKNFINEHYLLFQGCLFGSPFSSSCYQQHQEHYKSSPSTASFPTDWREPWHQEGNSCETDDSEQYIGDHDFHNQPTTINGLKLESSMPEVFPNLSKSTVYPTSYSSNTNFESIYPSAYQHTGCFYSNTLYNKMTSPHVRIEGSIGLPNIQRPINNQSLEGQLLVKQEPTDRDYNDISEKGDEKIKIAADSRNSNLHNSTGRRGSLQLWQFLVALLDAPDASAGCIAWTGRGMEFKLIEPEEVRFWEKDLFIINYFF